MTIYNEFEAMTIYQSIKSNLKADADRVKLIHGEDTALCRYEINNQADAYSREIDYHAMKGKFSEAKAEQYKDWLHNFAASLHPKTPQR